MSNKIAVLLAAYNGECYIEEQINTILKQVDVDIDIIISLDLSTDSTLDICTEYSSKHDNIFLLPYGEKFGGAGSNFYRLIKDVDLNKYDYISLSDQDDIWPNYKLSRAIEKLNKYQCYSANVTAFWADGREILIDKAQPQVAWDFLFEAAGPGCTYVFKRDFVVKFREWLQKEYLTVDKNIELHDWLIYAFARHHGYKWFIDTKPMMFYRQHNNNQVGTNNSLAAAKKRFYLMKKSWYRNQTIRISECLGLQKTEIFRYGLKNGYVGNLYLMLNINKLRRRSRDRILLMVALLFNIF